MSTSRSCHRWLLFRPPAMNDSVYGDPVVFWIVNVSLTESPGEAVESVSVQPGMLLLTEIPATPQGPGAHEPPEQPLPPPPLPPPLPPPPPVVVGAVVVTVVGGGGVVVVVVVLGPPAAPPPPPRPRVVVVGPPLRSPLGRPPKPWLAGGATLPRVGGGGGATPGTWPLSGGGVAPVGACVKV